MSRRPQIDRHDLALEVTDDHRAIRDAVRAFLDAECPESLIRRKEDARESPADLWPRIASLGWTGWPVESAYGGLDGDFIGTTILVEELARGYLGLATLYVNSAYSAGYSIGSYGSPELKRELLPGLASGAHRFAFGFSEPDSGQDVFGALKTRARVEDGRLVLNGQKLWTTNATVSDYIIVLARTRDGERKTDGLSVMVVDADAPGVRIQRLREMVFRQNPSCEVYFDDVEVPLHRVIGELHDGWRHIVGTLDAERIMTSALAIGNGQAALDHAVEYAQQRQAFGGPIGRFQGLQHPLARASVAIDAARLLTYQAASLHDRGLPAADAAIKAKIASSEAGVQATDIGMRVLAGFGHVTEYPMERFFRDARVFIDGPITNEMSLNQVAQGMGLPRSY